jgi:signal transduction histidine kinase
LQIETALRDVGRDPERVRERLEVALSTARSSLDEARTSVMTLRGGASAAKPLAQALAAMARELTSESGIRVQFSAVGACSLPAEAERELFRIAQQALTNVHQHASARNVSITLRCNSRGSTLTVEDDGVGFDPRRVDPDRHGLVGMKERARLALGTLRLTSSKGKGTKIVVRVPR